MSRKLINELPVVELNPSMLVPTGGFGDLTVNFEQLKEYVRHIDLAYITRDPNLKIENGNAQILILDSDQTLSVNLHSSQYIYLQVQGSGNLDISAFTVIGEFEKSGDLAFILVANFLGELLLIGCNYSLSNIEVGNT